MELRITETELAAVIDEVLGHMRTGEPYAPHNPALCSDGIGLCISSNLMTWEWYSDVDCAESWLDGSDPEETGASIAEALTAEDVAGLLSHYSRRAMQPVSTGARIIADHVQGGKTYSKNDALGACDSLETASRFISEAVRAPVFSFAAITEGTYKFVPASLDEIVCDCVALHHPTALEKRVSVTIDPGLAQMPDAEVDVAKMRDAIGYILDNAIKYSHENKEVRIYGELSGTSARLTIENFGLGIDEDELHMIFRRGYQGRRSRKAIYEEGEGLGLFQARRIIEAHKGKIWAGCRSGARSETSARLEGYRVWFTFELPLKQSDT